MISLFTVFMKLYDSSYWKWRWKWKIDLIDATYNILNTKRISVSWCLMFKQHLSKIWSSIYEKVKQHWGCVEKIVAYYVAYNKSVHLCINMFLASESSIT